MRSIDTIFHLIHPDAASVEAKTLKFMTNTVKQRVFVSSVLEGFHDFREAARAGIIAAGGEPVLIEDYPSANISPCRVS